MLQWQAQALSLIKPRALPGHLCGARWEREAVRQLGSCFTTPLCVREREGQSAASSPGSTHPSQQRSVTLWANGCARGWNKASAPKRTATKRIDWDQNTPEHHMWFRIIEIVLPSLGIQKVKKNYSNRHIKKKFERIAWWSGLGSGCCTLIVSLWS